jgi:hypothetical protein
MVKRMKFTAPNPGQIYTYHFECGGDLQAILKMNTTSFPSFIKRIESTIPGVRMIEANGNQPAQNLIMVTHRESNNTAIQLNTHKQVLIKAPWHGQVPRGFVELFYASARLEWINQGFVPIPAYCLESSNTEQVLLFAEPTAAFNLALANSIMTQRLKIFSAGKTLISIISIDNATSKIKCNSGTTTLAVPKKVTETQPFLAPFIVEDSTNAWFTFPDAFKSTAQNTTAKRIIIVNITAGEVVENDLLPHETFKKCYPKILDPEHADVIFNYGEAMFDGAIQTVIKMRIASQFSDALGVTPVTEISGSLENVMNWIEQNLKPQNPNNAQINTQHSTSYSNRN